MREADPMATRSWPGLGPVFAYEWLSASRRWQGYALRSMLVLLLLLGLSAVWLGNHDGAGEPGPPVRDRPDRRRDRAGQAGDTAGVGARPDRLRRPGADAGDAPRRR